VLVVVRRRHSRERDLRFGVQLRIRIEHEQLGIELGIELGVGVGVQRLRGVGFR
jgi:hypothetical protein